MKHRKLIFHTLIVLGLIASVSLMAACVFISARTDAIIISSLGMMQYVLYIAFFFSRALWDQVEQ
jgi:hypothetical protein